MIALRFFISTLLLLVFHDPRLALDAGSDATQAEGAGEDVTLALLVAIDEHEIAAARLALSKDARAEVADFARAIAQQHRVHLADTRRLAVLVREQPRRDASVETLSAQARSVREQLASLEGEAFEQAYLQTLIEARAATLGRLDRLLAQNPHPALAQHLDNTRSHVLWHLERAQALRAEYVVSTR